MSSSPYVKKNFSLAWPLALNALLMQSMLMIDTLLVSPLGELSLAAMGIATTIITFILGIQMALANGTQLVLSRAVGAGGSDLLSKSFCSGVIINCAISSLFWIILTLFDDSIIHALTENRLLHQEIATYLAISKYIVLYSAITQVIIALFNGLGKTKIPFKGYLIELPINASLSYLFIHGLDVTETLFFVGMGVEGAALGSLIAITIRLIYLCLCMHLYTDLKLISAHKYSSIGRNVRLHFIEIFPIAANVTILSIGAAVYMLLYSQLDINDYVAIALVMPIIQAGTQFITAWAHSSAIMISQAIGSKKMDDLSKNVNISIDIAIGISVVSACCFAAMSLVIADIYPDLDDSTYQALAVIAPIYIFLPIARGYNAVHAHILRALGKTTAVFKINFTGQWLISIPLCCFVILGLDLSIFWAFLIHPFEEVIKALPFRQLAKKSLKEFDLQKAQKLIYE